MKTEEIWRGNEEKRRGNDEKRRGIWLNWWE